MKVSAMLLVEAMQKQCIKKQLLHKNLNMFLVPHTLVIVKTLGIVTIGHYKATVFRK